MLKRNRAQKYRMIRLDLAKGFCRLKIMVSYLDEEGPVNLKQNQT